MAERKLVDARDVATRSITAMLDAAGRGEGSAAEHLLPLVYDRLRGLAAQFLSQDRAGHTLQPTALVHEAYLKIVGTENPTWEGRSHFFAVAAKAMRQILLNHSRDRASLKRGGGRARLVLGEVAADASESEVDVEALEMALVDLERIDQRQCQIVELRFFGGMTVEDVARLLGLSERTIQLEWRMAKARLKASLQSVSQP